VRGAPARFTATATGGVDEDGVVDTWDVVVVGAGPAGASAALAARHAHPAARVLLLDRSTFPRDKACGDGVAPQAFDLLAELGVTGLEAGFGPVQTLRVEGPRGSRARRSMARPARVIPREVFDWRLVQAAVSSGVEFRRRHVRRVDIVDGGVRLDDSVTARVLVAADGATGTVARGIGIARAPAGHTAVAVRGYATDAPQAEQQIVMDSAGVWPAYAWSFPLADGTGRANVGYGVLVDPSRPVPRAALIRRLNNLMPWTLTAERWRGHLLPLASWTPRQPDGRVLLAGDVAHRINPLTGEGIWYAIHTGMLAGRVAVEASSTGRDPGAHLRSQSRRLLGRHTRHVKVLSRAGRTPALVDAAVDVAADDQRCFDDLVELGLSDGLVTPRLASKTAAAYVGGTFTRFAPFG
jgi:geranylgeranyl reductase family protein